MACTLFFNNITNGQDLFLPFEATANVTGMPAPGGGAAANIQAVSQQIDEGELTNAECSPDLASPPTASLVTVSVALSGLQVNTWHTLTLYAWDTLSTSAATATVTFRVIELQMPPMLPPSPVNTLIPPPGGP